MFFCVGIMVISKQFCFLDTVLFQISDEIQQCKDSSKVNEEDTYHPVGHKKRFAGNQFTNKDPMEETSASARKLSTRKSTKGILLSLQLIINVSLNF